MSRDRKSEETAALANLRAVGWQLMTEPGVELQEHLV